MKSFFVFIIALVLVPLASALPHTFYGTVSEGGSVKACAGADCTTASTGATGSYLIHVNGNNTDIIFFFINDRAVNEPAQVFVYGGVSNLDLTVAPVQPPDNPVITTTQRGGGGGGGGGGAPFVPRDTILTEEASAEENTAFGGEAGELEAPEASPETGLEGITGNAVNEGAEGTSLTGNVIGNLRTHAKAYSLLAMLILIIGLFILYGFYRKKDKEDKPSA